MKIKVFDSVLSDYADFNIMLSPFNILSTNALHLTLLFCWFLICLISEHWSAYSNQWPLVPGMCFTPGRQSNT